MKDILMTRGCTTGQTIASKDTCSRLLRMASTFGRLPAKPTSGGMLDTLAILTTLQNIQASGGRIWYGVGAYTITQCTNPISAHNLDGRWTTTRLPEFAID